MTAVVIAAGSARGSRPHSPRRCAAALNCASRSAQIVLARCRTASRAVRAGRTTRTTRARVGNLSETRPASLSLASVSMMFVSGVTAHENCEDGEQKDFHLRHVDKKAPFRFLTFSEKISRARWTMAFELRRPPTTLSVAHCVKE